MIDSITPPPELVQQWYNASPHANEKALQDVANEAAQWGADQELEACCEWVAVESIAAATELRAWRRPKTPSLKEQALAELAEWENVMNIALDSPIRRALEALPE